MHAMSQSETIERLLRKLGSLRKADRKLDLFGANKPFGHQYKVKKATASDLADIASRAGRPLPEEYCAWLTHVGFGAGPYYGLLSPERIPLPHDADTLSERSRAHGGDAASAATLTTNNIRDVAEKWRQAGTLIGLSISLDSDEGLLPIADEGCGAYSSIALSGELTGRMFGVSPEVMKPRSAWVGVWPEGVARHTVNELGEPVFECAASGHFGFFDWYEAWLDGSLAKLSKPRPE